MAHLEQPNPLLLTTTSNTSLTRKQKRFSDFLLSHPKANPTQAALHSYNTKNRHVAEQIGYENMMKPEIMLYLKSHEELAQQTVVKVMKTAIRGKKTADLRLALDSANSVLDRVHGKATTRVETENKNLNINVEASQKLSDAFTDFLKVYTAPD